MQLYQVECKRYYMFTDKNDNININVNMFATELPAPVSSLPSEPLPVQFKSNMVSINKERQK